MDYFDKISLAALITAIIIGETVYFTLKKRYKRQGRSIQYLEYKVAIAIVLPLVSLPFLLTNVISLWAKIGGLFLGCIIGIFYLASINAARRTFRNILGLPPEDEDTGETEKKDEKKDG